MAAKQGELTSVGCRVTVEKGLKMEDPDPIGSSPSEGLRRCRKTAHISQDGTIREYLSWETAKQTEQEADDMLLPHCWEPQWQEFLKMAQSPYSGCGHPQFSGPAFLVPPETSAGVCHGSTVEAASGFLSDSREESPKTDMIGGIGDGRDVNGEAPDDEAFSTELWRQRFRWFCYQEASGPREVGFQLRELCLRWLKPEMRTKEQIVDLILLEQFLAVLPEEIQNWVGEGSPKTCTQAVDLAEDFLLRQQEAEQWKQEVSTFCVSQIERITGEGRQDGGWSTFPWEKG